MSEPDSKASRKVAAAARRCAGAVALAALAACSAPVGFKRVSVQDEHRQLTRNALTSGQASDVTEIIVRRYNLVEMFDASPEAALAQLREVVVSGRGGSDELFALAELSYLQAARTQSREQALAAALYAYAYLFPENADERPRGIDPRFRWACDIYAEGLTQALRGPDGRTILVQGGTYPLPFGTISLAFDDTKLRWGSRTLKDFVPVSEYEISGLRNRYRQPGIGVSLAAETEVTATATAADEYIEERMRVPATLLMRLDEPRRQVDGSALQGRLDLYVATEHDDVDIGGTVMPLEIDRTATVAITLAESQFWNQELAGFLGNALGVRKTARLVARQPYRPGRIPVVFVHGTNSSNGRWADMVNDLENDPRIRSRYQFMFFSYDSGNPIAYSAMLLRRALRTLVQTVDPQGHDACLREMVIIGHSQGGLLTKMTAIDSGDAFWANISSMPMDEIRLSDASRTLLNETLFIKPMPEVSRVVFIATPHRGSYLASYDLVRRLAAKLISMPREITSVSADLFAVADPSRRIVSLERFPTSIDNMSPNNGFIKTLSTIPVDQSVAANSIIPVEGDGPLDDEADGVVAYASAHVDGVESERVIRPSSHSTQSNPETIDEVRRILLTHAELHPCAGPPPADTSTLQPKSP